GGGRGGGVMAGVPVPVTDLARALGPWIARRPATIEGLTRMSGGASREIWAFDAVDQDGARTELVLRRDPPGRPSEPGAIDREARALSLAAREGLAVPKLLFTSEGPGIGAAGRVIRRVAGGARARRV